ncbi:MAG: hypothetical protein WBA57_10550 [Elainellaceae cyanobacterium]
MTAFTKLHRIVDQIFDHVFDALLVSSCAMCDRSASDVCCIDCWRQIQQGQLSLKQGIEQVSLQLNPDAGSAPTCLLSWGNYQGSLKRAIATLKYGNQEALGHRLGQELGHLWVKANLTPPASLSQSTVVVPIPLHAEKQAQRGYNQAELIAAGFCDITGFKLLPSLLERSRSTEAQFGLSVTQREHNLTGAFRVNRTCLRKSGRSPHRKVILIDDIYTTGATIRAAAATLALQQISVAGIAAMARPQRDQSASKTV